MLPADEFPALLSSDRASAYETNERTTMSRVSTYLNFMGNTEEAFTFYRSVFWLQVLFYCLAAVGLVSSSAKRFKPIAIASTFVMLNAAAAVAFYNFVVGRKSVWV